MQKNIAASIQMKRLLQVIEEQKNKPSRWSGTEDLPEDFARILYADEFIRNIKLRIERTKNYLIKDTSVTNYQPTELEDIGILASALALTSWQGRDDIERTSDLYKAVDWTVWNSRIAIVGQAKRYAGKEKVDRNDFNNFKGDSENYLADKQRKKTPILLYLLTGGTTRAFANLIDNERNKTDRPTIFLFGRAALAAMINDLNEIFSPFPVNPTQREDSAQIIRALRRFQTKFLQMLNGKKPYKEEAYINKADMKIAMTEVRKRLKKLDKSLRENSVYGYKSVDRIKADHFKTGVALKTGSTVYVFKQTRTAVSCIEAIIVGKPVSKGVYKIQGRKPINLQIDDSCSYAIAEKPNHSVFSFSKFLLPTTSGNADARMRRK